MVLVSACNCQYVGFCWVWFLNGVIENHIKERLGCVPHSRGSQIARLRIMVVLFVYIPELHRGPHFSSNSVLLTYPIYGCILYINGPPTMVFVENMWPKDFEI